MFRKVLAKSLLTCALLSKCLSCDSKCSAFAFGQGLGFSPLQLTVCTVPSPSLCCTCALLDHAGDVPSEPGMVAPGPTSEA